MSIKAKKETQGKADIGVFFLFEDSQLSPIIKKIDASLNGIIKKLISQKDFKAGLKETLVLYQITTNIKKILLVGLGKRKEFSSEQLRKAISTSIRASQQMKANSIQLYLESIEHELSPFFIGKTVTESSLLTQYRFQKYKSEKDQLKQIKEILLITTHPSEVNKGINEGQIISDAVKLTRELVNEPSSNLPPSKFASRAKQVASSCKLKCTILTGSQLAKERLNGLLAVNAGSMNPAAFVVLEYKGAKTQPICLVGKGIIFDSGGLGIKPANGMKDMKMDKAGAATVLGIMQAASQLKLHINLVGIMPLTENMPGNKAYKPGDIIKTGGKNIEILHTDAEGRIVLADGLNYASRFKPAAIINYATLTGACEVALGDTIAGAFTNNDKFLSQMKKASEITNEKIWQLPIEPEHIEMIKSDVADIKNIGAWDSKAGAITAAAFLKEFVPSNVPWVHLDIAGTAWSERDHDYLPLGGTGFGISLTIELLKHWKQK